MWGVTDLETYLVGMVLIVLLPGPNSLFVLTVAARDGVRRGYAAACGVFAGDAVLMLLAAVGVASLLQANETAFAVVKYLGAGYLAWLAIGLLRAAWSMRRRPGHDRSERALADQAAAIVVRDPGEHVAPAGRGHAPAASATRRALVISLLNPKAILFFVAFFVQFVDPAYPEPVIPFLVLAVLLEIASFLYLSALIFAGARLAEICRQRPAMTAGGTSVVGVVFLGFALKLATASV
ncbi:MAG: leucine efflux protein LeuE [Nocardioides sp.]|nr:leucine efflux protein LeuE [Nocardioides sp.]